MTRPDLAIVETMEHRWTSRMGRKVQALGRIFRTSPRLFAFEDDADARRMRSELDAIRARFADHA